MAGGGGQKFVDRHPTLGIQRDANRLGIVTKHETEELADFDELLVHDLDYDHALLPHLVDRPLNVTRPEFHAAASIFKEIRH